MPSRSPARFNRLIVQGRERIDLQEAQVVALADARIAAAPIPYHVRVLNHRRGVLIDQFIG